MASFTANLNPVVDNSFTNASQGASPNRALGTLFSGLGSAVADYQKNKDKKDVEALSKDAESMIGGLNSDVLEGPADTLFTPADTSATSPDSAPANPPGIDRAEERLKRLKQAYGSGKMSDLHYQTQVAKISKELRAKYPGQEDKVDDILSNITGTSPANHIRRELNALFDKELASQTEEQKDKREYLEKNPDILADAGLQAEYENASGQKFDPANYNKTALMFVNARHDKIKNDISLEKSRLELEAERGKSDDKRAYTAAAKEFTYLRDRILSGTFASDEPMAGTGIKFKELQKSIASANSDGTITPDEQKSILQQLNFVELSMGQAADQLLNGVDKNGFSYNLYVKSDADKTELRNILLGPVALIRESLLNKDAGILQLLEIDNKARQTASESSILRRDGGIITQMKTLRESFPELAKAYTEANARIQAGQKNPEDMAISAKVGAFVLNGGSLTELLQDIQKDNPALGPAAMKGIDTVVQTLENPAVSKEEAAKAAAALFSDKEAALLKQFGGENPEDVLARLAKPSVTEKLKGTPVFNQYAQFVKTQAAAIMTSASKELVDTRKGVKSLDVRFDEKTKRFTYDFKPLTAVDSGDDPFQAFNGYRAVSKMNKYLDTLQPILDEEKTSVEDFLSFTLNTGEFNKIAYEGNTVGLLVTKFNEYISSIDLKNEAQGLSEQRRKRTGQPDNPSAGKGSIRYNPDTSEEDRQRQQDMIKELGASHLRYTNKNAIRNKKLTPKLEGQLSDAVQSALGEGYSIEVFSGGQEGSRRTGSRRHNQGQAADVYVIGPDGKKVRDKKLLNKLKQYWLDNGYGSVGTFMADFGMHLDEHAQAELRKGEALSWNY